MQVMPLLCLSAKKVDSLPINRFNKKLLMPILCSILFWSFSSSTSKAQSGATLNFDGNDDYVSVATGYPATDNITYEAWVKPTAFGLGFRPIVTNNSFSSTPGNIHFQFDGGSLQLAISGSGDYLSSFIFSPNTWYHVAATYSKTAAEVKFYVNGALTNTASALTPPSVNPNQAFRIGGWAGDAARDFVGDIDEVRIWSVVRSQLQISANRNCEVEQQTGLQMVYNFNQGVAGGSNSGVATLTDASGNSRNGVLTNFALAGASSNWVTPGGITSGVSCTAVTGDYRTITTGTWENASSWQIYNGTAWIPATTAPDINANIITIRHNISINANRTIDQTVLNANVNLNVLSGTLTVQDQAGEPALTLNGTVFWNNTATLNVQPNSIINGSIINFFYGGSTLINNGTINVPISMEPYTGGSFINGTGTISSLTIRNNDGVTLGGNQTITSLLNFNFGLINTGANTLILASTASVQNNSGTDWYVNGNLQTNFPSGTNTRTYRIGDAIGYRPVTVTVFNSSGTGGVAISTTNGDHPNIGTSFLKPAKSVNRYWTVTNNGQSNTDIWATFTWTAVDVDGGANANSFVVGEFVGGSWFYPSILNQSASDLRLSVNAFTSTQYQIAETNFDPLASLGDYRTAAFGGWNSASSWETYGALGWQPATVAPDGLNSNKITVRNGFNSSNNSQNIQGDQIIIEAGAQLLIAEGTLIILDDAGVDMELKGTLNMSRGTLVINGNMEVTPTGIINAGAADVFTGTGNLDIASSGSMNISNLGDPFTFDGGLIVNNSGSISLNSSSSTMILNGPFTKINNIGTFTWDGLVNIQFNGTNNAINNNEGAFYINGGGDLLSVGGSGASFNNSMGAILTKNGGSVTSISNQVSFKNEGTVYILGGNLLIDNFDTNLQAGTYNIASPNVLGGTGTLNFKGPIFTVANGARVALSLLNFDNDGTPQNLGGGGTIERLKIDNPGGLTLGSDITIDSSLDLNFGRINTASSKLILDNLAVVSGGSNNSYVQGIVERNFFTPGPQLFPVGGIFNYAPVTLDPSFTVGGSVQVSTTDGDHPDVNNSGIDPSKTVNRSWTITNISLTFSECDVTFNWDAVDVDGAANPAAFILGKLDGGIWTLPAGIVTNANQLTVGNLNSFSEFQIGEPSCFVNIPDPAFKSALVNNILLNTNDNGEIECSEAAAYNLDIIVDNRGITDLTGIEALTGITSLTCGGNQISSLNLQFNTALTQLNCQLNPLTTLDLSANPLLTYIGVSETQLSTLDVSQQTGLTFYILVVRPSVALLFLIILR